MAALEKESAARPEIGHAGYPGTSSNEPSLTAASSAMGTPAPQTGGGPKLKIKLNGAAADASSARETNDDSDDGS